MTPSIAFEHGELRSRRLRKHALKVQQAIAECDGWSAELHPPKPFDQDTGEVFDWTATAINELNGNTVPLKIGVDLKETGAGNIWVGKTRVAIPLEHSTSSIAEQFLTIYDRMIADVLEHIRDDFELKLNVEEYEELWEEAGKDAVIAKVSRSIYEKFLAVWWTDDYDTLTGGVVNSKKLADALLPKIKKLWDELLVPFTHALAETAARNNAISRRLT